LTKRKKTCSRQLKVFCQIPEFEPIRAEIAYAFRTMPVYELLLSVGVIGYLALMAMGLMHGHDGGHHGGGHHGANHGGHAAGHHHGGDLGHAHDAHHGMPVAAAPKLGGHGLKGRFWLSPLDIFSLSMGGGLTGILLRASVQNPLLAIASILGAIGFCYGLIKPFTRFLMNFASKPSAGLEATIAHTAIADANFDSSGRGVVNLVLEGEHTRLLATLLPEERGQRVHKGDQLTIVEVDSKRGTCIVTTLLSNSPYLTLDNSQK
jgi:hypothetical protein